MKYIINNNDKALVTTIAKTKQNEKTCSWVIFSKNRVDLRLLLLLFFCLLCLFIYLLLSLLLFLCLL